MVASKDDDYLTYSSASSEQNGDGSWAVKAPYRTLRSLTIKTMHSALSEEIRITQFPGIPRHHGAMASLASSGQWWVQLTVTKGNLMSAKSDLRTLLIVFCMNNR